MLTTDWRQCARDLRPGRSVRVPKGAGASPASAGAQRSVGLPVGQVADWRLRRADGGCLHVRDMGRRYDAHVDRVDPSLDLLGHLRADEPLSWALLLGASGWVIGAFAGAPWKGAGMGVALALGSHWLARRQARGER